MDIQNLLMTLLIGGVAGWIAGLIMKGGGFGILGNIIVGILGAVVGGFAFNALGVNIGGGIAGTLVSAVVGAVILLFVVRLIKK